MQSNLTYRFVAAGAGLCLAAAAMSEAAPFDAWGWGMKMTFTGYNPPGGTETLTNFPVLVTFEEGSNGFHYAQLASPADAADLRFSTADGMTELNYEVDTWTTAGVSAVWVQVPALSASNDAIVAYWGRDGATAPAYTTNGAAWSGGFTAVWHMKETSPLDSGPSRYRTTGANLAITNGVIGNGLRFNGTNARAAVTNAFGPTGGRYTVEMWARTSSTNLNMRTFESYLGSPLRRLLTRLNEPTLGKTAYYDTADRPTAGAGTNLNDGAWHHLVYVLDQPSNSGLIYQDGLPVGSGSYSITSLVGTATSIGSSYDGSGANYFAGELDEVRFATAVRSSNWVWAAWMNQVSNRLFIEYADAGGRPVVNNAGGASGVTTNAATMDGALVSTGTAAAVVRVFWNTVDGGTNRDAWTNSADFGEAALGPLSTNITGLAPDSTYYYAYYASNAVAEYWASPSVSFVTSELRVERTADADELGSVPGTFTVFRAATATNEALTVSYTLGGTASNGVDYAPLSGTATIAAGADRAEIVVAPLPDALFEPAETVTLTLAAGPYALGASNSATVAIAAHDVTTWQRRLPLAVTGYAPPGGETPLTNFPLLVRLGTDVFGFEYSQFLSASHDDLRFTDEAGMRELPYEIESWDTNGVSCVWVQVPVLTNQTLLHAMWGRSGLSAPAYTTNGLAWDGSYIGVWHMAQTGGQDSTSNRFSGAASGTVAQVTTGVANGAVAFGGTSSDYIQVPDSPRFTLSGAYTVSAWINADASTNAYTGFVGTYSGLGFIMALTNSPGRYLSFWSSNVWQASVSIPTGVWKQVAYMRSGTNGTFYVDGVRVKAVTNALAIGDGGPLRFGQGGTNWSANPFGGQIDEVRISSASRSSNWMWAAWFNMASNGSFATCDDLVTEGYPGIKNTNGVSNATTNSATLNGTLLSTGSAPTTVWVYWNTVDAGTNAADWTNSLFLGQKDVGLVATNVPGLTPDTTYYYTYVASNANGVTWARPSQIFLTSAVWIEGTADAYESGLVPGTFTVHRASTATAEPLTVSYAQTGGTAVPGTHFAPLSGSLILPPGVDSTTVTVTPFRDWIDQTDRTLQITLTGAAAPLGPPAAASMTIWNEPVPTSPTNVWIRSTAAANASLATNWSLGHAPTNGEIVYLGPYAPTMGMTWDIAEVALGGWEQTAQYTGTVTVATKFPGRGMPTNLLINGDCNIAGGSWTHLANTGDTLPFDRLSATVEGNFTLGSNTTINLTGKGYASQRGPGAGNNVSRAGTDWGNRPGQGASYGGRGTWTTTLTNNSLTYGSPVCPTNLGSGANVAGGGALDLRVRNTATIHGTVSANGIGTSMSTASSGGSLRLIVGQLAGTGRLEANGGDGNCWSGGGGRIAVVVTNADSFGNVVMQTRGGNLTTYAGAGTVYRETMSQGPGAGVITVNNEGINGNVTPFPWEVDPPPAPQTTSDVFQSSLLVTNLGRVLMTGHLRMKDLAWLATGTSLALGSNTLFLTTNEHAFGTGTVTSNRLGRIAWNATNITYVLTVNQGPHGSASTNMTGAYPEGETVAVSALPDADYDFILWDGDLAAADATNREVTLTMDRSRTVRALFGSTQAAVRTWVGLTSSYATNPANWYPAQCPTTGDTVVLDATSVSNLIWDLDAPLAAWNQQTSYTGTVTIRTRYPGMGTFTNLAVTGDCVIASGTWTHPGNSNAESNRLSVSVGGSFLVASNALIDLNGRGYAAGMGPGHGNASIRNTTNGLAASHGGRGMYGSLLAPAPTYGSIVMPTNLGSGAATAGGGALYLQVAGTARVDGTIRASASVTSESPAPSGGSVYLAAAALEGTGLIDASGGSGSVYQNGGGGRVAVVLSSGNTFTGMTIRAYGGSSPSAAAGSVYLATASSGPAGGVLTVNNNNYTTSSNVYTEILGGPGLSGVTLVLTNRGCVGLASNATFGDLFIRTNTATRLYLNGNTLYLRAKKHDDWGHTNWVVYAGGRIAWPSGALLILR